MLCVIIVWGFVGVAYYACSGSDFHYMCSSVYIYISISCAQYAE